MGGAGQVRWKKKGLLQDRRESEETFGSGMTFYESECGNIQSSTAFSCLVMVAKL